jgi:hypothetical protein
MKTVLLSLLLILGLSGTSFFLQSNTVSFAKEYNPKCNFEDEEASEVTKIVKFPQYGIQMEIPENLRTMLREDGTIEILNNSTYRILQCPLKDREGRGYTSYQVYKAKGQYMKTVPIGKGLYFVVRSVKLGSEEPLYYEMAIRVQTSVGLVDVSIVEDRGAYSKDEVKEAAKEYLELAKMISLLE